MVILQNLEDERSDVTVSIDGSLGPMRELFGGDDVTPSPREKGTSFTVSLGPREVRVYRA